MPKSKHKSNEKRLMSRSRTAFEHIDWESRHFTGRWTSPNTRRDAKYYFARNTLPFIERFEDTGFPREEIRKMFDMWLENALHSSKSKGDPAQVHQKMNRHLSEAKLIYAAMQVVDPTLKDIDFSPFENRNQVKTPKKILEAQKERYRVNKVMRLRRMEQEKPGTILRNNPDYDDIMEIVRKGG